MFVVNGDCPGGIDANEQIHRTAYGNEMRRIIGAIQAGRKRNDE